MSCRLWVWCVLLALPIYGLSGALVQLMGPAHFHHGSPVNSMKPAIEPDAVTLVDFRRDHVAETTMTPAQLHELSHRQNAFMRHYHSMNDDTVIIVESSRDEGASDAPGSATAGSACLALGLADRLGLIEPAGALRLRRHASSTDVPTVDLMPPDQPPKT